MSTSRIDFYADNTTDAVDETAWVELAFDSTGRNRPAEHMIIANDDGTDSLRISFDGGALGASTNDFVLQAGETLAYDHRRRKHVRLRRGSGAGAINYRVTAWNGVR